MSKWRDLHCGEPRPDLVGSRVTLAGWADTRRDHGGLVFIDLRDHTGICQLVINPEHAPEAAAVAHEIRNEFVLRAEGEITPRAADAVNPNLPTGEIELQVTTLEILNRATPLPFQLDEENVDENLRLKYRWLDLRRGQMQRNLRLAGVVVGAIRRRMEELGFVDLWTPSLIKGTPEGARDFLVPVRLQPGRFFALAQSPQVFKQLFMISGFDRYYQIATCWRDEDLRADRQFEFRQLDIEMAFAEREDVLDVLEEAVVASFEALDRTPPPRPFPRLAWHDVMARYGSDKPDLRFGLEIEDATELTRSSEFGVFSERRGRPLPDRPEGVLARRARPARGAREGVGREGPRLPRLRRERGGALADRQVPLGRRAGALQGRAGLDRALRRGHMARNQPCPRRPAHAPRPRARAGRPGEGRVPVGDRLPGLRVGRGRTSASRSRTIRSPASAPATRS